MWRVESEYSAENTGVFTICSLVFGEFLLFNGKIYQTNESLNPDIERADIAVIMDDVKTKAATIFMDIKTIGLGICLPMFIYSIAKLLASDSSSAVNNVKWKKIIGTWFICFIFLFFIQYMIVALDVLNDTIMDILWDARVALEESGYESFEHALFTTSIENFKNSAGFVSLGYGIEYVALLFVQILFLLKYGIRALALIFLTVAAPVLVLLHSFMVMNGKESTIFKDWAKTYCSYLFMQPLHALWYLIFIFIVAPIAINAPLLGILFLYALYRAEKISKLMLNIDSNPLFKRKG